MNDDLRPYQRDAVEAVLSELADAGRTTLVMACGSGKTWTGLAIAGEMLDGEGLLLIAVPSLALMQQWYAHAVNRLEGIQVLGVCSDEELRDASSEMTAPTTTSEEEIANFIGGEGLRLVLCTYHSSPKLGRVAKAQGAIVDLLIADEAHRTAGAHDAVFTTVLFDNRLPAKKRLFLTATPRMRLHGRSSDGSRMISMADEAIYGKRALTYTFGQAIDDGYLSDYRVVVMVVSDKTVHRKILQGEGVLVGDEAYNVKSLVSCLALSKLRADFHTRSALVFHNTISASRAFTTNLRSVSQRLDSVDAPNVYHLDGVTPQIAREAALRSLAKPGDGWTVASNVRVLTEGVDVPSIDAVMFAEPKRSQIDVVQAIGRALRLSPQGNRSLILIPVYLAPEESAEALLSSSEYRHIWQVINAIRDHDRSLDQEIESIRRNEYDPSRPRYEPQVMPERIMVTGFDEDLGRYENAISTLILDNITTLKSSGLDEFIRWMDSNQDPDVPTRYVNPETHFPLGRWVQNQRQAYRWGRLTDEEIRSHEEVGFSWGARSKRWRNMIARIEAYRGVLGADRLSAQTVALYDADLYDWIREQDARFEEGKASKGEREELLKLVMGSRGATSDLVNEARDNLLAYLHKKQRSRGKNGKRILRVSAVPDRLTEDLRLVCNNHFLLDEDSRREFIKAGLNLSSRVRIVPGEEDWEKRVIAAANDELDWDGIRFIAANKKEGFRNGSRVSLDRSTGLGTSSPRVRRAAAVSDLPLVTLHELFPIRNWICISERTPAHHIPKIGRYRYHATLAMVDAESNYHDVLDLTQNEVLVVADDLTVWKAPSVDSPESEWSTSGRLTHHLDEIAYQTHSEGNIDAASLLERFSELGEFSEEDRAVFLAKVRESYYQIMSEVIRLTLRDLFPGVRVRRLDHNVDIEQHIRSGIRNRRHVTSPPVELDHEMQSALMSAYSEHVASISRLLLGKLSA